MWVIISIETSLDHIFLSIPVLCSTGTQQFSMCVCKKSVLTSFQFHFPDIDHFPVSHAIRVRVGVVIWEMHALPVLAVRLEYVEKEPAAPDRLYERNSLARPLFMTRRAGEKKKTRTKIRIIIVWKVSVIIADDYYLDRAIGKASLCGIRNPWPRKSCKSTGLLAHNTGRWPQTPTLSALWDPFIPDE